MRTYSGDTDCALLHLFSHKNIHHLEEAGHKTQLPHPGYHILVVLITIMYHWTAVIQPEPARRRTHDQPYSNLPALSVIFAQAHMQSKPANDSGNNITCLPGACRLLKREPWLVPAGLPPGALPPLLQT